MATITEQQKKEQIERLPVLLNVLNRTIMKVPDLELKNQLLEITNQMTVLCKSYKEVLRIGDMLCMWQIGDDQDQLFKRALRSYLYKIYINNGK